ncbi:MAG: glycosyltransferase N-terminal domain-containing protein [Candidatus Riflebacteria bacterium]|nr:glycosyltransferase N-terminal domain-containing protein [Candidatus Riflebacteria bacterium]
MERQDTRPNLAISLYRIIYTSASVVAYGAVPYAKYFARRVAEGLNNFNGHLPQNESLNKKPVFWVHAVSMGESLVANGFISELRQAFPKCCVAFTTTHPDVYANAKKKQTADIVAYFPLDSYVSMKRAFDRWHPDAVFVAETDFWPEFSWQCRKRKIPLMLINGRISSKIHSFYSKFPSLADVVFGSYECFAVQTLVDRDYLLSLGVSDSKIKVLGNMKADLLPDARFVPDAAIAWKNNSKCIVLGSLHNIEYDLFKSVIKNRAEKIVFAPRNLANAKKWFEELKKLGFKVCLRSDIKIDSDIMILDTMGELAAFYSLADAAFVGGTIDAAVGGHNPLEVIQQNVPLVCGKNYRNFTDIIDGLKAIKAVEIVETENEIIAAFDGILASQEKSAKMTKAATEFLNTNKGVLKATLRFVEKIIFTF